MRKTSGIRFADSRFLREFEREARCRFTHDEISELFNSYTVHRLKEGLVLEFRDAITSVATFLEKARAVGLAGRSFRIVKLVVATPTESFLTPSNAVDHWARPRIENAGEAGRHPDSLIFTSEAYERLTEDFGEVGVDLGAYLN